MINSLWISKTGMQAQQTQLDVISNNMANVSTNGFKRATAVFEDLMYQNLRQTGANATEQNQLPTGLQVGLGTRAVATSRSFTQGNLQTTERSLDVAIRGNLLDTGDARTQGIFMGNEMGTSRPYQNIVIEGNAELPDKQLVPGLSLERARARQKVPCMVVPPGIGSERRRHVGVGARAARTGASGQPDRP